jgi:tRNA nucleotidyltransferase (CCA-adding enzyme)
MPVIMNARWEHFEHQADIGVRGYGGTPAEAFEQAGLAMVAIMVPLERVARTIEVKVACEAPDYELLFTDWLNSIVREMSLRRMVFSRFFVSIEKTRLSAVLWGEPLDSARHEPSVEVKAATYYALKVGRDGQGGWVAQCVVDV